MSQELRTIEEIQERIRTIQSAWREMEGKASESRLDMREGFIAELAALYWVLGYSRQQSLDNASVVLGGDPVDWG